MDEESFSAVNRLNRVLNLMNNWFAVTCDEKGGTTNERSGKQ